MENSGFRVLPEQTDKRSRHWSCLWLILLTLLGMALCLQEMFQSDMPYLPTVVITMVAALFGFMTCRGIRILLGGLAGLLCILAGAGVFLSNFLLAGTANFLNQILAQYNYITGQAIDYFTVPDCDNETVAYFVFLTYALFLLGIYISQLIYRKHGLILFLCWLPILAGGLYLKLDLGAILVSWAAASIVGCYAYSRTESKQDGVYGGAAFVVLLLMLGLGTFYYHSVNYHPSERIASLKESLIQKVEQTRFGKSDYPLGDVKKAVNTSKEERLKVTLSQEARVYLKGYTGSVLDDNKWSLLDPTNYSKQYEGMLKTYVQNGFHPLAQLACYSQAEQSVSAADSPFSEMTVSVENVSAFGKYIYIPYGISFDDLSRFTGVSQDTNVLSSGEEDTQEYQVESTEQDALISYQGTDWLAQEYDGKVAESYRQAERDYRSFVEKHYISLTSERKKDLENQLSGSEDTLSDITDTIRLALAKQGKSNSSWTSVNYATEGVEMYRFYEVPARYVEGYVVQGEGELSVTAQNSHAWVEIYKNGVGWIPVDVTPGYYTQIPQNQQNSRQNTYQGEEAEQQKEEQTNSASHQKKAFPWVMILLVILVVLVVLLLLFVLALVIYRKWLWNRRVQEMGQEKATEQLKALSGYLYDLSVYLDRDEKDLPEEMQEIFAILWYSNEPSESLGKEETGKVKQYVRALQEQIWQAAGFFQKQKLRYWKHLEYPV